MDVKLRSALFFSLTITLCLALFCWIVFSQVKHQTAQEVSQSLAEHVDHEVRHITVYRESHHSHETTLESKHIYHRVWTDDSLMRDSFPKELSNIGKDSIFLSDENRKVQRLTQTIEGSNIVILAYYDLVEVNSHLETLQKVLILGNLGAFFIFLPLSWFLSTLILRPFRGLARMTRELDAKQLSYRFPTPNKQDEFGVLVESFNALLERLEKSFHGIWRFATNASHELRTPLTVIRGEAELALRRKRTPEEYETTLNTIAGHAERLQQIIGRLLALSDIERMEQQTAKSNIPLKEFTSQIVTDVSRLHPEFSREIRLEGEPTTISFQQEILSSILTNLIENAIKYAKSHVHISYLLNENTLTFKVADDGQGISPENIAKAFEPFFTSPALKRIKGHGLGLSIVKACIDAAGGTLTLNRSERLGGLEALVTLPNVC